MANEYERLMCGCIPDIAYCLFCDTDSYLKYVSPENKTKVRIKAERGKTLLAEGLPIDKVREMIFKEDAVSSAAVTYQESSKSC